MFLDIFARMSEVELLCELRHIASQAGQRGDLPTAQQARTLFDTFYTHRLRRTVPEWVWEQSRTFVRQHAS